MSRGSAGSLLLDEDLSIFAEARFRIDHGNLAVHIGKVLDLATRVVHAALTDGLFVRNRRSRHHQSFEALSAEPAAV
jgi:hypothetical protein